MIWMAQVPQLPGTGEPGGLAASILRPTRPAPRGRGEGSAAVDAIQATLGDALVLLASLAVVLLVLILLLIEVDVILRLGNRAVRRLRSGDPGHDVRASRTLEEERGR
jgi:hypothetical protein